jgi:aldose 1-epimerase
MTPVTLQNEHLRAVLTPDPGVSLLAFSARKDDTWLDLTPDAQKPDCDLKCASFLMVPYSNRIENGAFTFQNQHYQLERGAEHAIHGDVRTRPWKTEGQTQTRLCCSFDSRAHENINWPWPFAVRAEYELQNSTLVARLALWNRGDSPMPAGFGWHPYFNRVLTSPGEPAHLCFQAQSAYPDANDNRIPSGPPQPLAPHQDFSTERPLTPDSFLDTCLRSYDGGGHITWPQSGIRLRFACSPTCTHLILYNPAGKPYFAVEPVTNANDGVNLLAGGDTGCGTVVLEPGQNLEARFELDVELL